MYWGNVSFFFKSSFIRQRLLDKAIDLLVTEKTHSKKLKDACQTRWLQHIDSFAVLLELLPAIHMSFQAIVNPAAYDELGTSWNWDGETNVKANGFLYQLQSSSFLISFKILLEVLSSLRSLTLRLQKEAMDVFYAHSQVNSVVATLKKIRDQAEKEFKAIFSEATKLGKD